jgi:hypothetical protein
MPRRHRRAKRHDQLVQEWSDRPSLSTTGRRSLKQGDAIAGRSKRLLGNCPTAIVALPGKIMESVEIDL